MFSTPKHLLVGISGALGTKESHFLSKMCFEKKVGGFICLLYICIVLDLAVGVAVCKASGLKYLGGPSAFGIYMCIGLYIYIDMPLH